MSSAHVIRARRNASVLAVTAVTIGVLFLFPTSTNRSTHLSLHSAVPPGVVSQTSPPKPAGTSATPLTTINGAAADTRYGPVQVQVQIRARRIVSAKAIDYPQGSGRDREINSYAIPVLQKETLSAQSANVDTVSGATYTSEGYAQSLQSALDAAHF